jgi:hypothetical protein
VDICWWTEINLHAEKRKKTGQVILKKYDHVALKPNFELKQNRLHIFDKPRIDTAC